MDNMPATMPMEYTIGIKSPLVRREVKTALVEGDRYANTIVVNVMDNGEPYNLDGCSVLAVMKRADNQRPFVHGTVEGNRVAVCLNEGFYAVPGRYELLVRLTHPDGTKRVILWLWGYVADEGQGDLIDTENVVPDLEDLLAQIDAMEQATAAANTAATTANTAATNATATAEQAAAQAVETANTAAAEAVQIATEKGDQALQNVETAVEAQNATIAQLAADILTKAPAIECEASGSLVTVTDAAAQPAVELITHIEPVQEGEGDPSPDNVRPIKGWDSVTAQRTGKNLFIQRSGAVDTIGGLTVTYEEDHTIVINGTLTENKALTLGEGVFVGDCIASVEALSGSMGNNYITFKDASGADVFVNKGNSYTAAFKGAGTAQNIILVVIAGTHSNLIIRVMVRPMSIADSAYEPYSGQTLTAALPETVYGAENNWTLGEMLVDRAVYTLTGDEGWKVAALQPNDGMIRYDCAVYNKPGAVKYEVVCDTYPHNGANAIGCWTNNVDSYLELRIMWTYDTVEELTAYLKERYSAGNPVTAVYYIEPYTLQLTPQQLTMLRGTNNVWSSTGDTSLVYVADTKMYIDEKFDELQAAILSQGSNV